MLLARQLEVRLPGRWRRAVTSAEKDLVYVPDQRFSVELKTSGQRGNKIFGNRSVGQKLADPTRSKKEKSGYFMTANFTGRTLRLLRFGWIDEADWLSQLAPTGQMSGLPTNVYAGKLMVIPGEENVPGLVEK